VTQSTPYPDLHLDTLAIDVERLDLEVNSAIETQVKVNGTSMPDPMVVM
jgi:hypothetical protein